MAWEHRTLLLIAGIVLPLFLYIASRLWISAGVLHPPARIPVRRIAFFAVALCYLLPLTILLFALLGTSPRLLQLPHSVGFLDGLFVYPIWVALVGVAELFVPFLVIDLIGAAGKRFARARLPRMLAITRVVLAGVAMLYVPIRIAVDTTHVRDSSVRVGVDRLPRELEGLRITLIGDLQMDRYTGGVKAGQVGEILTARAPELLVSAGDVVTSGREYLDDAARALCGWKGSVASAGVLGDHDLWSAPERVREMQVQCGWLFLENEHRLLRLRGRAVCLTGLTHVYGRQLRGDALSRFLASAPRADLHILLTHQPAERVVDAAASARYDIVLAGHTHGGQIVLHPLGIPLTPSMRETRYVSGTYAVGSMTVVVTNGIGLTLAPIRYHAPAEVTSIVVAGREGNLTALP